MFNDYIELTADPSNPNIVTNHGYEDGSFWKHINYFLPITIEQTLMVIQSGETSALLLLVHFELQKKTYKILDYVNILKCQYPEFVRDGDIFGLFFPSSIDGESVNFVNNETSFFTLLHFTVQKNHIKIEKNKQFNYKPFAKFTYPMDLYLHNNKLWYFRKVDQEIHPARRPPYNLPPEPPQNPNLRICYFNLDEIFPTEIFVDEIQIEKGNTNLILQWVQDSLVFRQSGTKFNVLNLLNFEWKSEALDSGMCFTNLDIKGGMQSDGRWAELEFSKHPKAYWANTSTLHIDSNFIVTAIDRFCIGFR